MYSIDVEDVKDIAVKLNKIYIQCPEDFFFLKGWIHCLRQKDGIGCQQISSSSDSDHIVT